MSPILYSIIGGASMLLITSIYRLAEAARLRARLAELRAEEIKP